MIGLVGQKPRLNALSRMSEQIVHRGPDASGTFIEGNIALAFRRLAILDLTSRSHQPLSSQDGRAVLVFNGEIYNFIELRDELSARGHTFQSDGDAEVLLTAYLEWGTACLDRLNGMWAFLIYDRQKRIVFGARDHFGIKPLYFYRDSEWLLFASEIKAICASGLYEPRPNWRLAARYLLEDRLSVPNPEKETLYEGVYELPAASAIELRLDGKTRDWTYWKLEDSPTAPDADPETRFAELLEDSIRLRMRSDVPIGVHLSGGLDSTAIICHMARQLGKNATEREHPLRAFSYTTPEFDEMPQIEATVAETGAELYLLSRDAAAFWERMIEVNAFHDEPLHSMNVVVSYELYRATARRGVKVVLNGQGADETLAGYGSYFNDYWYSLLSAGRVSDCWREIKAFTTIHGGEPSKLMRGVIRHWAQTALSRLSVYRLAAGTYHQHRLRSHRWFTPELADQRGNAGREYREQNLAAVLRRAVTRDPLPLYLRVEDRNSMAHSIEARLPFLDHRLVEFAWSLQEDMKLRGPWNKYVLRQATAGVVPEVVRLRPDKMGFPVPQARWFAGPLQDRLRELVTSRTVAERGIYRPKEILRDLDLHGDGKIDVSDDLFRIVQFEMFCHHITMSKRPIKDRPSILTPATA